SVQEAMRLAEVERAIGHRLPARLGAGERKTAEALEAVQTRLSTLDGEISQVPVFPERPEDVPGYQALETALRKVVEHIETSEKASREALNSVHDRMGEIAQKAATAESERVLSSAPVIARLDDRLADVVTRLERTEAATQHALPRLVRSEE